MRKWTFLLASGLLLSAAVVFNTWAAPNESAPAPRTLEEFGETLSPGVEISPALSERAVKRATAGGLPYESRGVWGMSPHATPAQVEAALALVKFPPCAGPIEPTWRSIDEHYRTPEWLVDGKFGIFIHFGLYSIPGVTEWYQKHMYSNADIRKQHIDRFGPLDKFGYKDFIPLFTLPKFEADEWAEVFQASGARWVMPTAEHHDGYSLWDSEVNPFNSVRTGPKRDFIGELGEAVRQRDMKFGVTNHTIEHYNFIEIENIPADVKTDLHDKGYEDLYWVNRNDARMTQHLANWTRRNIELIDKYQPDLIWFDNGLNHRVFDPLKLSVVAYYYNRAREWQKDVTVTGKGTCFISGGVQDFEDLYRAPREPTDFTWMVHDRLIDTWGYSENAKIAAPDDVIRKLVEVVARNGVYALNVAPKGDGSIPDNQQQALRAIGHWMQVNGEAIYGTRPWLVAYEGAPLSESGQKYTPHDIRFTSKDNVIYAILMAWPADGRAVIKSLATGQFKGEISSVTLLGSDGQLKFSQNDASLTVELPSSHSGEGVSCLKLEVK